MVEKKETIIISLGGSLVAPGEIDLGFLKSFKHTLSKYLGDNPSTSLRTFRFFLLVGGGKICRVYQNALLEFGAKPADRDWMGINITNLNAQIVKQMFNGNVYPKIVTDPNVKVKTNKDVIVGAGWKPGWSTDYDAVLIAKNHNVKTIVNLTNVDYVYDRNPNEFPDAKPLKEIDWKSFERIVGDKWSPGLSMPFDPRASKLAARLKLKVIMINGKNLERLEDFLNNKPFIGTTIQ
jgi:uridylate kinase